MKHKVAVVILNWNGEKFLQQFLPGVIKYSSADASIVVADNASTDLSISWVSSNFPDVEILVNDKNEGFAKGYNLALKKVEAEYYVLLNSDVEVTENWILPLLNHMESNPEVAVCQPKILDYKNKHAFEYAGAAGGYIDRYGYPFCRGRLFTTLEKDEGQYDDVQSVFWATGACMMVRSDVFHQLGGFDERFFAHMEEIDFCWRAQKLGKRINYVPGSIVFHVGGGTLASNSPFKTYLNIRNNLVMLYKNLPAKVLHRIIFSRLLLDGVAALKFMLDGGVKNFYAVIKAHIGFYQLLPQLIKERKKSRQGEKVSSLYHGNIVMDYFIKGKRFFTELDPSRFSK